MGLPGDVTPRSDASGHPINRAFADVTYDKPVIEPEPGFEGQIHAFNLYDHIARADITWNPSFTSITGACICCVTSEEHMLPVIHGNDRNEWFIQLTDEIHWNIQDKNTGNPARPHRHEVRRRLRHAGRHPSPGLCAEALDADGVRERHAGTRAALRQG